MPYFIANEITVRWVLPPTGSPLTAGDYDITVLPSSLEGTYTSGGVVNFVAPTAEFSGSMDYLFTPYNPGKWTVVLSTGTGTAYTVIDRKHFWLFSTAVDFITAGSVEVLGHHLHPTFAPFATQLVNMPDVDWYDINGVNQDPVTGNIVFAGRRLFTDTLGTLQILDIATGAFTNYTTIPHQDISGICMNNVGRVYILKTNPVSNAYQCHYSDPPYSTWTLATWPNTNFSGNRGIYYDPYDDKIWWGLGTQLLVTTGNGTNFVNQQYDSLNDGNGGTNVGESGFWKRSMLSTPVWHAGGSTLGGAFTGQERAVASTATGVTPLGYASVADINDAFGNTVLSRKPLSTAVLPDNSAVVMFGGTAGGLSAIKSTTGMELANWSGLTHLDALPGYNISLIGLFFSVPAFGKIMFVGKLPANAGLQWWESTDGTTWNISTDTRFTSYGDVLTPGSNAQSNAYVEMSNGGVAFIEIVGGNQFSVVYAK